MLLILLGDIYIMGIFKRFIFSFERFYAYFPINAFFKEMPLIINT